MIDHILEYIGLTDWSSFIYGAGAMLILICILVPYFASVPTIEESEEEYGRS